MTAARYPYLARHAEATPDETDPESTAWPAVLDAVATLLEPRT